MPFTTAEINAAVDFVAGRSLYVSIHTGDPGATGANEVTAAPYGRKAVTWNPATGTDALGNEATVDVPAGSFTHFGLWPTATGGTFRGGGPLTNAAGTPETATYTSPGQIKVTPVIDGSSPA